MVWRMIGTAFTRPHATYLLLERKISGPTIACK